jgi:hypothetical protein
VLSVEPDGDRRLDWQRCEAGIEFSDLDLAGWLVRHAWEDGVPLTVCPAASGPTMRRIVTELRGGC